MTDSKKTQTDESHIIDLVEYPFCDWLRNWVCEEALRQIEPTLKHMFEPTLKRITTLLGGDGESDELRDSGPAQRW
ncbi:hypothetical protein ACFQZZ_07010 [Nocardia sp. GCM10030253]|uniref:hypothetical protein n=1 Tax=Nocardia sp. GCM10030253 TaxID=3273404 RepID=UPI0036316C14